MAETKNTMNIRVRIYTDASTVDFSFSSDTQGTAEVKTGKSITVTLKTLTYQKQVGAPCYARAEVYFNNTGGLSLKELTDFFVAKKVDLTHGDTDKPIAMNYFIYKATPSVDGSGMTTMVLETYSLDKLLDTVKYSRSYTARKLRAEILPDAIARCKFNGITVPYASDDKLTFLAYGDNSELIQPYIVQYNETPYSMLRRTANRCGELLFFEGGELHMGIPTATIADTPIEVKNNDENLRYLSVSYSDSVNSTFGNEQEFHLENYHEKLKDGSNEAIEYVMSEFANIMAAFQGLLAVMKTSHTEYNNLKKAFDIFNQNDDYYTCYYKAKKTHSAYLYYKDEIAKKQKEIDAYGYKSGIFSDERLRAEFEPYMEDAIKSKEHDLQAALDEQTKNDYYSKKKNLDMLAEKAAEARKAWQTAKEEESEDVDEKLVVYQEAQSAYNTEAEKYKPNIDTLIAQEIAKINTLRNELNSLRSDLTDWKDNKLSADTKKKLLDKYKQQISERLKKQYDALASEKKELEDAQKDLLEIPEIYKPYKDEGSPWDKFSVWEEVIKAEKDGYKDRLDKIWSDTLKKGENRFPISIDDSINNWIDCTNRIKAAINKNASDVLKDEKRKDDALLFCNAILKYCYTYIVAKDAAQPATPDTSQGHLGVYDFEYANDEYLQKLGKDEVGNTDDIYFSSLTQNQSKSAYAAFKLLQLISGFINGTSPITSYLGAVAGKELVVTLPMMGISLSLLHSAINSKFIDDYQLNGANAKIGEFSDGTNMSLFTTYNRTSSNADVKEKGMSDIFAGTFYKAVFAAERALAEQKITIRIDCTANKKEPQIGSKIKFGDQYYIITNIAGSLTQELQDSNTMFKLEQTVEAIPVFYKNIILPAMSDSEYYRKSDPQIATVAADDDPTFEGRVRVRFHWQSSKDEMSPWIRVGTPYATKGGGMMFVPHQGDQVMLDFEHGNIERPYVATSLYSKGQSVDTPTPISKVLRRQTISSANGHGITFIDKKNFTFMTEAFCSLGAMSTLGSLGNLNCDNSAAGGVEISDSYGFYNIACSADKRNITIESPFGDVNINAFTGLTISAPNGDVKINAKNIELTAGNEIKITSGTFLKDAVSADENDASAGANVFSGIVGGALNATMGTVDLSLLRHLTERFLRPVSASLSIKSYRFILIDSGRADFDTSTLMNQDSYTYRYRQYKGWKAGGLSSNGGINSTSMYSNVIGKTKKEKAKEFFSTLGSMIQDEFWKQVYRIGQSFVTETNLWNLQSSKDTIIISGNVSKTNAAKNQLQPVDILKEEGYEEEKFLKSYDEVNTTNMFKALYDKFKGIKDDFENRIMKEINEADFDADLGDGLIKQAGDNEIPIKVEVSGAYKKEDVNPKKKDEEKLDDEDDVPQGLFHEGIFEDD